MRCKPSPGSQNSPATRGTACPGWTRGEGVPPGRPSRTRDPEDGRGSEQRRTCGLRSRSAPLLLRQGTVCVHAHETTMYANTTRERRSSGAVRTCYTGPSRQAKDDHVRPGRPCGRPPARYEHDRLTRHRPADPTDVIWPDRRQRGGRAGGTPRPPSTDQVRQPCRGWSFSGGSDQPPGRARAGRDPSQATRNARHASGAPPGCEPRQQPEHDAHVGPNSLAPLGRPPPHSTDRPVPRRRPLGDARG